MNSGAATPQQNVVAAMASARHAESDVTTGGGRWKAQLSAHQASGVAFRNIVITEKRRRAHELAAKDMHATLKQETLDALRQKAHDLQHDKWMHEDVHMQ